jgi:hypothetical protein
MPINPKQRHGASLMPDDQFHASRRQILATMLTGLLIGGGIAGGGRMSAAAMPNSTKLFTPRGAGDQDGRDWRNAMGLKSLSKALGSARPGSAFMIGFDPGAGESFPLDASQVRLAASGSPDDPIQVQAGLISGTDDLAAAARGEGPALFRSSRGWSLANFGKRKSSCYLAVTNGASHIRLSGFRVDGTGADGFVKFRAKQDQPQTFEDIVISRIDATNVGRIVESDKGATLRNVIIEDCRAVGIVRGFARFRTLTDSVLRKLDLDADHMDAGGRNVCQLIALSAGENIVFEDVVLRNAVNDPRKSGKKEGYVQGDGIVCERGTRNVTLRRCHGSGMGDSAFDIKATDATIEDSSTDSCKYGARLWSDSNNVIRRCDFRNPQSSGKIKGACIEASGRLEVIDTKLQAGPGTVAIKLQQPKKGKDPVVHMRGGSIQLDGDAEVALANGAGVLELHQVAVNGVTTDHRYVFEKKKQ